jgi:hypothetical protein
MDRHEVTERELDEWLRRPQWQLFASSCGPQSNKRMEVDAGTDGSRVFRVTDHGETIFLGVDQKAAIATYNNAR